MGVGVLSPDLHPGPHWLPHPSLSSPFLGWRKKVAQPSLGPGDSRYPGEHLPDVPLPHQTRIYTEKQFLTHKAERESESRWHLASVGIYNADRLNAAQPHGAPVTFHKLLNCRAISQVRAVLPLPLQCPCHN